ncbi:MAG: TIGR04013 family B12-binding domain/radical SAM domain-containing protein, partial [Methanomicrobiales archaeon]|nr:TIGR04013 family B12-binding domain/radical SAM domain-containing protein [Methanomicrobiales archaeon]
MIVNWRYIPSAQNSYAALRAACEVSGFSLNRVNGPADDVTCYSLNSFSAKKLRHEIATSKCITVAGGPHATACYSDLVRICNYVVVGEGEFTLPLLLTHIEAGKPGSPRGVATAEGYAPAGNTVVPGAYPPFGEVQGFIE